MACHYLGLGKDYQRFSVPKPRRTLYIDGEMPLRLLKPRLDYMPKSDMVDMIYEDYLEEVLEDMPNMASAKNQARFMDKRYITRYDHIVIDTTNALVLCDSKEFTRNDPEYWLQMQDFNRFMRRNNVGVTYIDHTSSYDPQRIAGSIQKMNNVDWSMMMVDNREDKEGDINFDLIPGKCRVRADNDEPLLSNWRWGVTKFQQYDYAPKIGKKNRK